MDILLTAHDLAARLKMAVGTIENWRMSWRDGENPLERKGPKPTKIGYSIRYYESDVHEWLKNNGALPGKTPNDV